MIDQQIQFELQNLISRYVWALDLGDVEKTCSLFTADAVLRDTSGNRHVGVGTVGAYFDMLTSLPEFRGRQHHIDNCLFEQEGPDVRCRSYWTVTQWLTQQGRKDIVAVGHSSDRFVRQHGEWRFAERLLYHWRDADCPWKPAGTA